MSDPSYWPQQSITFYAVAEREHQAAANERAMTVWAVIALAIVVFMLTIGGCS